MRFNTFTFLVFFAIVLIVHHLPLRWRTKKFNLLIASYVFYAAWNPPFVVLLWISTLTDWFVGRRLGVARRVAARRALLVVSLCVNLGMLGFFKYGAFLLGTFSALASRVGVQYQPPAWGIVLPVGISFYTFQTLSYTLDIYMGKARPWHSFLDYALFVTFFPQLVAGPIVRAVDFLPQCPEPRRATRSQFLWGLSLLTLGLFQKVVLADFALAPIADEVYGAPYDAGCADAWLGTLAFSGQIFFDFAGYSACAIGTALCLGFALPDNFRQPYAAVGFRDFWRRWHISLSTWLRDYVYIPLGGSRCSRFRSHVNVMVTMLIGGLWHGASWRFVAWGGLHGVYLLAERLATRLWGGARWAGVWPTRLLLGGVTYLGVCLGWVFFRASDFPAAFAMLRTMLTGGSGSLDLGSSDAGRVVMVTMGLLVAHWWLRKTTLEEMVRRAPWWLVGLALAFMLLSMAFFPGENRAFIYFQF
jgi:D-alanyl-lipoteichoic acid acyltransferase DltB (MBOAT superfamily)